MSDEKERLVGIEREARKMVEDGNNLLWLLNELRTRTLQRDDWERASGEWRDQFHAAQKIVRLVEDFPDVAAQDYPSQFGAWLARRDALLSA